MRKQTFILSQIFRESFLPPHISKEVPFRTKEGASQKLSSRKYPTSHLKLVLMTQQHLWLTSEAETSRCYAVEDALIFSWGNVRSFCAKLERQPEAAYAVSYQISLILLVTPPEQREAVLRYISQTTHPKGIFFPGPAPIVILKDYRKLWLATRCMLAKGWPWQEPLYCVEWANALREDPLVSAFL